ncbi:MAG: hypothetical protein JO301_17410 [Chitinophagaceae bacterium]|nr:hypothetical protein [Chitinophagaceae bacterium]
MQPGNTYHQPFADRLQGFVSDLADCLADVFESAGNTFSEWLRLPPGYAQSSPLKRCIFSIPAWFGNMIAGIGNLLGVLIKALFGIAAGIAGAGIKMVLAPARNNRGFLSEAAADLVFPITGSLLLIGAHSVSLLQRCFLCQRFDRRLSDAEWNMLLQVFGTSVSLYNIRIVDGWSKLFGSTGSRAFTLGNLIIANKMDFVRQPWVLVHECVHVWQSQHLGNRYAAEALFAQWRYRHPGAYDWTAEPGRGKTHWLKFNPEAAAELIEDAWLEGSAGTDADRGRGTFFSAANSGRIPFFIASKDRVDHTALALEAWQAIRSRQSWRWSGRIKNPGRFRPAGRI